MDALRPLRHLARGWPDWPPSVFTVWQSELVPKTFDSDFYVVCATVIPVLFLAVAGREVHIELYWMLL